MIDFLDECRAAQDKGKYVKFLRKTANMNLIILDDFMLTSIDQKDAEYLYRLFNSQPRKSTERSFIICSQLKKEGMYEKLSLVSPALADAIMNRVVSRAYELTIEGPSMREVDIPEELKKMRGEKTK
jgi:DNA replication protein DnaC